MVCLVHRPVLAASLLPPAHLACPRRRDVLKQHCIVILLCLPHLLVAPQARNEILEKVARLKQSPDAKPQHLTCESPLEEETRLVSTLKISNSHAV